MKKVLLFSAFFALTASLKAVYITGDEGSVRFHDIIKLEMAEALKIPEYSPGMKAGSSFIITACPGIPLGSGDLSFVQCDIPFESPEELDKAYLFARLVNVMIPNTQFSITTPAFLANGSFVERAAHENLIEDGALIEQELSDPHFTDEFYYTTVNPPPQPAQWTHISARRYDTGRAMVKKRQVLYRQPSYTFSADMKMLPVYRPWLKLTSAALDTSLRPENTFAIITQLIISKNIVIDDYRGSVFKVSAKGKVKGDIQPASCMKTDSAVIVGFVCLII